MEHVPVAAKTAPAIALYFHVARWHKPEIAAQAFRIFRRAGDFWFAHAAASALAILIASSMAATIVFLGPLKCSHPSLAR